MYRRVNVLVTAGDCQCKAAALGILRRTTDPKLAPQLRLVLRRS